MLIERAWRVTMADVDAAGVIYYGSPLRWAEMLLGDWLDGRGHSISAMLGRHEAIPAVGVEVRYRSPLSLDDRCRLSLSAVRVGRTSFTVRCAAGGPRGDGAAVEVDTTHAYVRHGGHKPGRGVSFERQPLPAWLREPLEDDHRQSQVRLEDDQRQSQARLEDDHRQSRARLERDAGGGGR